MADLLTTLNLKARRGSLRLRLTMWMVAIFLVVQLSLALVFQLYQAQAIRSFFNQRLLLRVQNIAQQLESTLPVVTPTDESLAFQAAHQRLLPADQFRIDLRDAQGQLVASSKRPGVDMPGSMWESARNTGRNIFTMLPADAMRMEPPSRYPTRSVIHPFIDNSGRRFYLVAAINDDYAQEMLRLVQRVILIGIPIGLAATLVSAYVIAGVAVRPYSTIRHVASQLSPESIGRHLEVPALTVAEEVAAVQRELELARQRIEAGFHAQERFMSNVSHELKTPIATILTESQLLKTERAGPEVQAFVGTVSEELEKLGRMVDSFLLLTRVRHGKSNVPAAQRCEVGDVLLDSYASCQGMATQYGVRVEIRLPEGEDDPIAVVGNPDLLRTVFDNIIRNAIKFSPRDSVVTVTVSTGGESVHVAVRDHGPGIPEALLPKIFDRFSQATEEQRRGRGHGLGLEIAQGVAELHAGSISVRNLTGGGCEFTITLPLAAAPGTDGATGSSDGSASA